ncbi:MAG: hypothetical protein KatS3mg003_1733 [Candidatus Nitrosocaldaceae archaeon]|nr:MAG: hypothetical protein KatS3mg003_1733 [Candidatus Nitrosocaldaceae archaeon]
MLLRYNLIFVSIALVLIIALLTYITLQEFDRFATDARIKEMFALLEEREDEVVNMHQKAKEHILFAVANPIFKEYFSLPESRNNLYDDNHILQFTNRQIELKNEMEIWIKNFQSYFNVDETCVIDTTGQEHARLVLSKIAPIEDLSPDEEDTPFFEPSFERNKGEVYVAYPYVSPDTNRWVFAYTTPIVLDDGSKPAFFHFEIPLEVLDSIVSIDKGRMYIIDAYRGYIIADSESKSKHQESVYIVQRLDEYFRSVDTIAPGIKELLGKMQELAINEHEYSHYYKDGEIQHVVYEKLPTFDWVLVYELPHHQILSDNINDLTTLIASTASIVAIGGISLTYYLTRRVVKPIIELANECNKLDPTDLKHVNMKSNDETKQVADAINNLIDRVNSIEKQKEEFTSMITHELKTPLTPIIGWSQALKNEKIMGELTPKQLKAVDAIHKNAERLRRLIGDILDAQKLDLKKMRFDYKEFNVGDMMNELYTNLKHAMKPKNIEFVNATDTQTIIRSDKNRIEQVLNNMIFNAIDFVPENGRIEIAAKDNGNDILFYVKDNGIGIPKDKQNDLFKKFYQIDTSAKRKHGGSGLGLAICKGIVEALGGNIWVESQEGKGSTFYFTIPKVRE